MKIPQEDQGITFADWGYLAIAKHFRKIIKHEIGVLEDQDCEELHQMRVGMRRLRSAILGFNYALILPEKVTQKKVGKIAAILGNLRDVDVLLDTLKNTYQPNLPEIEQIFLNMAINSLEKTRKYAFIEVKKTLHGKEYIKLKKGLKNWLDSPEYNIIGAINIRQILPDLLLPQISNFFLHEGWLVGADFSENNLTIRENLSQDEVEFLLLYQGEKLHDLRKEAKKVRYNLELFTQFYGETYQEYLNQVKQIQTVLGDLQDIFVLREFLGNVFSSQLEQKLPTLNQNLTEIRYQKWQEWQFLQDYFLNTVNKDKFRETISLIDNKQLSLMNLPEEMG